MTLDDASLATIEAVLAKAVEPLHGSLREMAGRVTAVAEHLTESQRDMAGRMSAVVEWLTAVEERLTAVEERIEHLALTSPRGEVDTRWGRAELARSL